MKNFFNLVIVNIKRMMKDPGKIAFMFIIPFAIIVFINFVDSSEDHGSGPFDENAAYNIEDKGNTWKRVFKNLDKGKNTFINDREGALELLDKGDVSVVYNIPEDFSEKLKDYKKPSIGAYKIEEGNTTLPGEIEIDQAINNWIEEEYLLEKGVILSKAELQNKSISAKLIKDGTEIEGDLNLATIMIIYFIILGASTIGPELMELKEKNIISRAVSTPNSSFTILGSLAVSLLVFQVGINMLIFGLGKLLIGYQIFHLHIIFVNIVLASMFSITLSLAATRFFKNIGVVGLVTALVSIITMILGGLPQLAGSREIPAFIVNLGKFTPQYWITESLEKSVLFPNVLVVFLIIMVLFTAGSYRLKDF